MTVLTIDFQMAFWSVQTILLLFSSCLIFIQLCDSKQTQFNAEFTNQVMNFPLLNIVAAVVVQIFLLFEYLQTSSVPDKRRV